MAKVEKHGNKYRVVKMVHGHRHIISFDHSPTQGEIAVALAQKIVTPAAKGDKRSFKECAEEFLAVNDGALTINTLGEYRSSLRRLPEWFQDYRFCDIDTIVAQKAISEYSKEPTPRGGVKCKKTVDNVWNFVSAVLHAYGKNDIHVHTSGRASEEGYMPTEEDIVTLLKHIKDSEIEIPVMISAFASLREGELLALTLEDVKDGMVHVTKAKVYNKQTKEWIIQPHPKNKSSVRYTPIPKELEDLIYKKGYIYNGAPNTLRKNFNKACAACGIEHFTFHRLRAYYTCAAHYLGVPDKYIMKNGGWNTDFTLKRNYMRALADKQSAEDMQIVGHFSELMK